MEGISFPMLSDFHPKGEVTGRYGVYNQDRGHPNRVLFLVDTAGVIRWIKEGQPDIPELLEELDKIS